PVAGAGTRARAARAARACRPESLSWRRFLSGHRGARPRGPLPVVPDGLVAPGRTQRPPGGAVDGRGEDADTAVAQADRHPAAVGRGGQGRVAVVGPRLVLETGVGANTAGRPGEREAGVQRLHARPDFRVGPEAAALGPRRAGAAGVLLAIKDRVSAFFESVARKLTFGSHPRVW